MKVDEYQCNHCDHEDRREQTSEWNVNKRAVLGENEESESRKQWSSE